MILGWKKRYLEILKEFKYSEKKDYESAKVLNSILKKNSVSKKISKLIKGRTVFVVGSGPSLSRAISKLKNSKVVKIAADSSVDVLLENGIIPEIIVTDLDGDFDSFRKIAKTKCIFVVHAHGDNIDKLEFARKFKNCLGTTQTKPFSKIQNFGGFTDGDRGVFLANHHGAKKIVLFGMDFGRKIGKYSKTKKAERKIKLMKLQRGKSLLEWLATFSNSELFTTSKPLRGFKKISYKEVNIIIT